MGRLPKVAFLDEHTEKRGLRAMQIDEACRQQQHGGLAMLILTRRPGESVLVGQDIIITVTQISGQQVRIGIEAPKEVKVLRAELKCEFEQRALCSTANVGVRAQKSIFPRGRSTEN